MSVELTADLIESYLASARDAAIRREWGLVLELAGDVLVLDRNHADARLLQTLAERHVGRGHPSWGRRQETVLFADLVASTALANRVDPEVLRRLTRSYELACTPVITALGGHVHRFVGDGILASFGYPTAHEDDACRAVRAGLELIDAVASVSPEHDELGGDRLEVRVGVASGILVHADRGGGSWTQSADLFGPAVNLAARIHEVAAPGQLCISDGTAALVVGLFDLQPLGDHSLKGFDEPVTVHGVQRRPETGWGGRARTSTPFIGRDEELARLGEAWRRVSADDDVGRTASILVSGDAGVGKSRIVWELARSANGSTIELQCTAYRTESPLHPVRAAIEQRCGFESDDDDETRFGKLAELLQATGTDVEGALPYVAVLVDLGDQVDRPEVTPTQLRAATLQHLLQWIVGIAARSSTILVVEDLHWADPTTHELLQHVAAAHAPGLLSIVTTRTPPSWLQGSAFEHIALSPLSDHEARTLAAATTAELPSERLDEIARRSDGIPLFVEQLAVSLAGQNAGSATLIPMRLAELLQARLDSTGPSKRVAQLAATLGREFDPSLVTAAAQRLQDEDKLEPLERTLPEHFDRLIDSHLVEADPADDRRLRFRHALVGEAAYESQLLEERPDRHGVLAELLLERGAIGESVDPSVVAHHFMLAGRPVEAIGQYLASAARGHAVGAFAEVAAELGRALALLTTAPAELAPELELTIRMSRGLAISSMGGFAAHGAVEDFARSVELCELVGESAFASPALLRAQLGLWGYYTTTAEFETATSVSASMERQLERVTMPAGRPSFHACRGVELFFGGRLVDAQHHFQLAVEQLADDSIDAEWPLPNDPLAAALAFLGPLRYLRGDEPGALGAIEAGMTRTTLLSFPLGPFSIAFVRNYESWLHRLRGDYTAAAAAAEEVVRLGDQHGFFDWQMVGRLNVVAASIGREPTPRALAEMTEIMGPWRAAGARLLAALLVEQAWGYFAVGHLEPAQSCLADAHGLAAVGQGLCRPEIHRLRAAIAAADGSGDEVMDAELREGLRIAVEQGCTLFVARCAADHRAHFGPNALDGPLGHAVAEALVVTDAR